jgi:hypothetical protein
MFIPINFSISIGEFIITIALNILKSNDFENDRILLILDEAQETNQTGFYGSVVKCQPLEFLLEEKDFKLMLRRRYGLP